MISWTEQEWQQLAQKVFEMRLEKPEETFVSLVQKAVASLPPERQRPITSVTQVKRLLELVKVRINILKTQAAKVVGLQQDLKIAKSLIDDLDDKEILRMFKDRVLRQITADEVSRHFSSDDLLESLPTDVLVVAAAKRFTQDLFHRSMEMQNGSIHTKTVIPKRNRKPKVVIIGMLKGQYRFITDKIGDLCELKFVSKDTDNIPQGADIYVVWGRFVSHYSFDIAKKYASEGGHLITHHGGIETMITTIQERLAVLC